MARKGEIVYNTAKVKVSECQKWVFSLSTTYYLTNQGEVPEWFKGTVLKTVVPEMVPRVRISPSPPN